MAKMTPKNRKVEEISSFGSAECFLLRAEGFCDLDVLYRVLGISQLQLLIKNT
jgi:hypothetical protein